EIEANGYFTEPDWKEVISPDGVRCFATRFREPRHVTMTNDLSIADGQRQLSRMTSDAYEAIKGRLASLEWRLDNLYWVQDETGRAVRFVRNESQRAFWDNAWYLNAILKARQLGFSTL